MSELKNLTDILSEHKWFYNSTEQPRLVFSLFIEYPVKILRQTVMEKMWQNESSVSLDTAVVNLQCMPIRRNVTSALLYKLKLIINSSS